MVHRSGGGDHLKLPPPPSTSSITTAPQRTYGEAGWKHFIELSWKQHFIELSTPKESNPVDSVPQGFTDRGVASTPPTDGHRTSLQRRRQQG